MEFPGLELLDKNGNTRFVKNINEVRDLVKVSVDLTFVIPKKLENKIWAVAEILFGDTDQVEKLLHFNGLKPHKLPAGFVLKVPNLSDYQNSVDRNNTKPRNQTTSVVTKKSTEQSIVITDKGRLVFTAKRTK